MISINIFDDGAWIWEPHGWLVEDDPAIDQMLRSTSHVTFTRFGRGGSEPAPLSSRPAMGAPRQLPGGTSASPATFHFAHSGVRKGQGHRAQGGEKAAEFQLYIEREVAGEDSQLGEVAALAAAVARRRAKEGDLVRDEQGPLSFGSASLGDTPAERAEFWRVAAEAEKRSPSRVQGRVIAELPHWAKPASYRRIVNDWGQTQFESRGLAWWAAVHEPDVAKGSDSRNYHLHLVYSDRPVERLAEGHWLFHKTKLREVRGRKFEWGTECPSSRVRNLEARLERRKGRFGRPLTEEQLEQTRLDLRVAREVVAAAAAAKVARAPPGTGWVRRLRVAFAEAMNVELTRLAAAGHKIIRLYDPRSYQDAGLKKPPTWHLGAKQTYLERSGLPTSTGAMNRRREIWWKLHCQIGELQKIREQQQGLLRDKARVLAPVGALNVSEVDRRELAASRQNVDDLIGKLNTSLDMAQARIARIGESPPSDLWQADPAYWWKTRRTWARRQLKRVQALVTRQGDHSSRSQELQKKCKFLREILDAKRPGRISRDTQASDINALARELSSSLQVELDNYEALRFLAERNSIIANTRHELSSYLAFQPTADAANRKRLIAAFVECRALDEKLDVAIAPEIERGTRAEDVKSAVLESSKGLHAQAPTELGKARDDLAKLLEEKRPKSMLDVLKGKLMNRQPLERSRREFLSGLILHGRSVHAANRERNTLLDEIICSSHARRWNEIVIEADRKLDEIDRLICGSAAAQKEAAKRGVLTEVNEFIVVRSAHQTPIDRLMPTPAFPDADTLIRESSHEAEAVLAARRKLPVTGVMSEAVRPISALADQRVSATLSQPSLSRQKTSAIAASTKRASTSGGNARDRSQPGSDLGR